MSKKIIILFFLFFSLLSYKIVASEADQVNTDSEDFETTTIEDEIYDPFEPVNRAIFSFNNVADRIVLEPIAKGYKKLPSPIQSGINNILSPDWGDSPKNKNDDEEYVFWACGVTPQNAIIEAKIPFCITHTPGHMLITDISENSLHS